MVSKSEILKELNQNPKIKVVRLAEKFDTSRQRIHFVYNEWALGQKIAKLLKVLIREVEDTKITETEYDSLDALLEYCKNLGVEV